MRVDSYNAATRITLNEDILSTPLQLTIDSGSFAAIIKEGLYKPTPTSVQTNMGEFIQFNGASQDGTAPASVRI